MKTLNRYIVILMFVTLIHISGCASTTAPHGWLPPPSVAQHEGFGSWISVSYRTGDLIRTVHGELIAIHSNQVFILTVQELTSISTDSIYDMKLTAYNARAGGLTGWTCLGILSTISHGVFLIFTSPVWLIGGSIATVGRSYEPQMTYPARLLIEFHAYARFPHGLPEGIDRQSLKPKRPGVKISVPTKAPKSPQKHRDPIKF